MCVCVCVCVDVLGLCVSSLSHFFLSEYVGHVDSIRCDFETQQQCPWQLTEDAIITDTLSSSG